VKLGMASKWQDVYHGRLPWDGTAKVRGDSKGARLPMPNWLTMFENVRKCSKMFEIVLSDCEHVLSMF
jgi:hypothetical protein